MFKCDKCEKDGAARITLGFKIKNKENRQIENADLCFACAVNLIIRLLDRLPENEKVAFFKRFMEGIIV